MRKEGAQTQINRGLPIINTRNMKDTLGNNDGSLTNVKIKKKNMQSANPRNLPSNFNLKKISPRKKFNDSNGDGYYEV